MINFTTLVQFLELYLFVLDQKLRISIRVIIYVHEIYSTSHNQHGDKINTRCKKPKENGEVNNKF